MNLILSRFEQTVRAMPDKRAVGYKDTEYTFSALRSLSARLGCALSQRLPRGQAAGVLVRRGIETVAEFFAVVYAGGFYVPLDPDMPEHKLRTILEDAGIRVLLGVEADRPLAVRLGCAEAFLTTDDASDREA